MKEWQMALIQFLLEITFGLGFLWMATRNTPVAIGLLAFYFLNHEGRLWDRIKLEQQDRRREIDQLLRGIENLQRRTP